MICFFPFKIVNEAVCLLCRKIEISFIAIDFLRKLVLFIFGIGPIIGIIFFLYSKGFFNSPNI